jgi:hypothetical protein
MPVPTRPVSGAPIAVAWGQYVHDRALLHLGRGAIAVSQASDVVALAASTVWQQVPFSNTDKWDPEGLHSTTFNTYAINMDVAGLWIVRAKLAFTSAAGEHLEYAGVSYGAGLGSAPLAKDQRSGRPVPSVVNHLEFGPWYIVSAGGGGSTVELWAASSHASGTCSVNVTGAHGEFAAFVMQPDA